MKKCLIVNLVGAPGAGKSTGAAYIFSKLKMKGINCELITEYAKRKIWEENKKVFENQIYIFGKQYYSMTSCVDQLDVIITDSPLFLSIYYNKSKLLGDNFNKVVNDVFHSFNNKNYLLKRVKEYNPKGRLQTASESDFIYLELKKLLEQYNIKYDIKDGNVRNYDEIVEETISLLEVQKNKSKS